MKEQHGFYKVSVNRNTVQVQRKKDGPVERYMTNKGMEMIEALNDLKAIPSTKQDFVIQLDPPTRSKRLDHRRAQHQRWKKKAAAGGYKKRPPQENRPGPNPKDIFGVRAPAPRGANW